MLYSFDIKIIILSIPKKRLFFWMNISDIYVTAVIHISKYLGSVELTECIPCHNSVMQSRKAVSTYL